MAELTPLAAAQAEVEEVSGILKDNMGKVLTVSSLLLKLNGREWMEKNRVVVPAKTRKPSPTPASHF